MNCWNNLTSIFSSEGASLLETTRPCLNYLIFKNKDDNYRARYLIFINLTIYILTQFIRDIHIPAFQILDYEYQQITNKHIEELQRSSDTKVLQETAAVLQSESS